jgi:PAS domain S-box-containing protein
MATPAEDRPVPRSPLTALMAEAFSSLPSAALFVDPDGRCLLANAAALRLIKCESDAVLGQNLHRLLHPTHPDGRPHPAEECRLEKASADPSARTATHWIRRSDGTWCEILATAAPLHRGDSIAGTLVELWEIGAGPGEDGFRRLADSMPQIVWTARSDGAVDYYNRRWYEYTGLPEGQTGDPSWEPVVHPDDIPLCYKQWYDCVRSGQPFEMEYRFRDRKSGGYRWFLGRALPVRDAKGAIIRWLGTCTDIDDQKRAEEQLELRVKERSEELARSQEALLQAHKLEAIGRLAGGVAHDFNNLLTGIIGITEDIYQSLPVEDPRREDLAAVLQASQRASGLTRQLLAFGRRQVSAPRLLNLNVVLHDMERLFRRLLGEPFQIRMGLDPKLGAVRIDQTHLEQILVNLLLNARDAMPRGGAITLETSNIELGEDYARRHAEVQPGPYVRLTLSDTGAGMDADTLKHIFEPFFTTKERGKGTGLGLATVYGIVKQGGGDIAVRSVMDHGTTFDIYLPRFKQAMEVQQAPPMEELSLGGSERVLVVEDEEIVRRVAVKALRHRGYQVSEAASAEEAVTLVETGDFTPEILVTDVIMPGMNGRALADTLKRRQPELAVLYMSGHHEAILSSRADAEPEVAFLPKSFTPETLCRKVREVLDQR